MPMYDFECHNQKCMKKKKPHSFEAIMKLSDFDEMAVCPRCETNVNVKRVVLKAVPKSKSWRTY